MLIDFNNIKEMTVSGMNNGTGEMSARMHIDEERKIIPCAIHVGGSIGLHKHNTSDDINYIISRNDEAICDGKEEILCKSTCHICKKGSEHSIINTDDNDLVMLTLLINR